MRTLDSLEHAITKTYLSGKQQRLNGIISGSIFLHSNTSTELQKPRPYIYQLLSLMSAIQTEIGDVSRSLMRPLISELTTGIFGHFLAAIRWSNEKEHHDVYKVLDAEIALLEDILATGMTEEANALSLGCHTSISLLLQESSPEPNIKMIRFPSTNIVKQFASFQFT